MKAYINKAALVAEIEKRIEETESMQPKFDQFWAGQISAFKGVLKILNTLEVKEMNEEPVSEDLEEAAHSYVDTTIEWFDSEDNPCCYPAFIAGAQWQKEQLMKNAVKK